LNGARFRAGMALARFGVRQGSGAGFRRASEAINGGLMAFLCVMMSAVVPVSGKGARYA
jgi:hypothetical protein